MAGIDVQAFGHLRAKPGVPGVLTLLPGVIRGVATTYYVQGGDSGYCPLRQPQRGQAFLFIRGTGAVHTGTDELLVKEVAAFCPAAAGPINIIAGSEGLEYLEILIDLQSHETLPTQPHPFFMPYSDCEAYTEAIKSPKTVSRTLVPTHTLPRFCMGSVETSGPDTVGAHAHPMLEQLFFGLAGNRCIVTADDDEAVLEERMLLHIPSGSRHGVRVEGGCRLHYVWMDFFRETAGLAYIHDQHKPVEDTPAAHRAVSKQGA